MSPAKKKPVINDEEEVVLEKPQWTIYTMLLLLSLMAIIVACICLYFELSAYDWEIRPKSTALAPPARQAVEVGVATLA